MAERGASTRWRALATGIRPRLLIWYVALFAVSLLVAILTIRQVLLARLDSDLDARLAQEASELSLLSDGNNPTTGRPFDGDAEAIFTTFLARNVPDRGETFTFLLDGAPFATSAGASPVLLDDAETVTAWARATEPTWADTATSEGPVRWLAVPVSDGDAILGTFVVSRFYERELADVDAAVRSMAVVSVLVLMLASALAWLTAGRVVAPIRQLTRTARYVSDHDLSTRLPLTGNDEVTELTRTFNSMLDRLESAFGTQKQFLDDIGHELRTPITIIRGHLELMPDDVDERGRATDLCLDELDRMSRYVGDLILLAKSGRPDFLRYGPVDVAELTNGIAERARTIGPDHVWSVERADQTAVEADGARLTQAWLNLVTNAASHTRAGSHVRLGGAVEGGWARLWVADAGPGIAREDQQEIFNRFSKGGARGRSASDDGSGLGLAIVAAIADAHGGRLDLETRLGVGSRFTVLVPAAPSGDGRRA